MSKYLIFACLAFGIALFFAGCSSPQKTVTSNTPTTEQRDAALERYLKGQTLDQQGNFASAVIEYLDALRFYEDPSIYYALSKDYFILDKGAQAIETAQKSVQLEPDNLSFRQNLAEIYAQENRLDGAIAEFEEIIKRDSSRSEAWHAYAQLLQHKTPLKSLDVCQQIIDRFGPDESIYIQMIQLYGLMGKNDKVTSAMQGLLALDPTNIEIKKTLGDMYMEMDSIDAALRIYHELSELHPENVVLRAAIAHAYLNKRDYDKAREQFDSLMTRDTLSIDDQLEFGKVFMTFIERDSAVVPYAEEMIKGMMNQYSDDWRPYWLLGAIANIKRSDSSAVAYFQKVTELAKWNPDGWVGVASVWFDNGELQKALTVLEEARKNVKEEFRVEFIYGLTLERLKRPTDAALALEHAIQLNAKSIDAYSALGLVYDELKRPQDADTMYERALRINPKYDLVLNNYGYSLADRGIQLERAATMIKQALDQQPNNTSYLDSMGWVHFKLGNYEEAERYIKKAIELGNPSAVLYEHLGDTYSKLNQTEKAQENWKKALEMDSSNQSLKDKIERGSL